MLSYECKIRGMTGMSKAVARFLYKELTDDESEEKGNDVKERQAFLDESMQLADMFVCACGDSPIVVDIRRINAQC